MRKNLGSILVVLVLLGLGAVLGRVSYIAITTKGLHAEAKLMLSYLNTLQRAQHMESDKYLSFVEYYGAPIQGQDKCQQPQGAAQLGFLLKWCHQEASAPLRYSYRLVLTKGGYRGEAKSGSDNSGGSFVCFGFNEDSIWQINKNRELRQEKSCHTYF